MRTRKEIEKKYQLGESSQKIMVEVLLDIRALLLEQRKIGKELLKKDVKIVLED